MGVDTGGDFGRGKKTKQAKVTFSQGTVCTLAAFPPAP